MLDFNHYLMRHGEFWIQGIVEDLERQEGISPAAQLSLEERWAALMDVSHLPSALAA